MPNHYCRAIPISKQAELLKFANCPVPGDRASQGLKRNSAPLADRALKREVPPGVGLDRPLALLAVAPSLDHTAVPLPSTRAAYALTIS